MKHTLGKDIERAAVAWLHNDLDRHVWCEEAGCWVQIELQWVDENQRRTDYVCGGCQESLAHPNHRWSRLRMKRDAKEGQG